jgi:transcriptional regulator with XRE-family HTH domain
MQLTEQSNEQEHSTNIQAGLSSDRSQAISRLINSRQSRESYIRSKLNGLIPSQIRALRLKQPMTQNELAAAAEMKQSRISNIEKPGQVQFNVDTLIRLAAALNVGLKIEFVSYSDMLAWENDYSQDDFDPIRLDCDRTFLYPQTQPISRLMLTRAINTYNFGHAHPSAFQWTSFGVAFPTLAPFAAVVTGEPFNGSVMQTDQAEQQDFIQLLKGQINAGYNTIPTADTITAGAYAQG